MCTSRGLYLVEAWALGARLANVAGRAVALASHVGRGMNESRL